MKVITAIISLCKLIIPSITGVAASWKYNCQGSGASQKLTGIKDSNNTLNIKI
jgi:hypothetical protein